MDFLPSFLRAERPSRARRAAQRRFSLPIPFLGRLHMALEKNGAIHTGGLCFGTHLTAVHFREGKIYDKYDLGSGAVSNVGVAMMANDFTIAGAPTLKEMNYHGVGTGATAAAASDYYLQTAIASGSLTGSTHGYYTGTQSFVSPNIYQSVATITAAAPLAVTEWGLFMSNASPFTGRSATATGNNTMTDSGAAFTTSGNALSGWAVEASNTAVNTPTTTAWGLVLSNTGTILTLAGPSASSAWLTLADAVASVPGATTNYVVYPGMWDHKVFSVVNLNAADALQLTYQLTVTSGG